MCSRAMNGLRLRWLSERGRGDRARICVLGMLKWVPDSGGEGLCGSGCGRCSCPVAGWTKILELSCRSGLQAAIRAAAIAAWRPLLRNSGVRAAPPRTQNEIRPESCSPPQPETVFSIHRWYNDPDRDESVVSVF